ncbi:MAG TPA: hypothetical protein VEF35_02040 [Candidatus Bathyarchaeia archaeon]|nr:hypothetical protein [Candidatus Bathyarchaeia archaeon]
MHLLPGYVPDVCTERLKRRLILFDNALRGIPRKKRMLVRFVSDMARLRAYRTVFLRRRI